MIPSSIAFSDGVQETHDAVAILGIISDVANGITMIENLVQQVQQGAAMVENLYNSVKDFDPESWDDFVDYVNRNASRIDSLTRFVDNFHFRYNGKNYSVEEVTALGDDFLSDIQDSLSLTNTEKGYASLRELGFNSSVVKGVRGIVGMLDDALQQNVAATNLVDEANKETAEQVERIMNGVTNTSSQVANTQALLQMLEVSRQTTVALQAQVAELQKMLAAQYIDEQQTKAMAELDDAANYQPSTGANLYALMEAAQEIEQ